MNCIICNSNNTKKLHYININDLLKLYKKMLNVDLNYLITLDFELVECLSCGIKFFSPLVTGDEAFYAHLQKFDWYYLDEKEEFKVAKRYISDSDKVLEVGCGKGAFAKYITPQNYIGLDFSQNAKKIAKENGVIVENIDIIEYAKNHSSTFDVVVSFQVLEHISDPKKFLEAKIEAIKPGGKMIISVPAEDSFVKYVPNNVLNMPPHHVTRWSDRTLTNLAKIFNLELVNIEHEKVQEIHKSWFISTLINHSLGNSKLVDLSFASKLKNKFSYFLTKMIIKKFPEAFLPRGHTVTAIYQKRL